MSDFSSKELSDGIPMKKYQIWSKVKKELAEEDLIRISLSDTGMGYEIILEQLKTLYSTDELPCFLGWDLHEVLSISSWGEIESRKDAVRILFCSIVLLASLKHKKSRKILMFMSNKIIRAIKCADYLNDDWVQLLYSFFSSLRKELGDADISEDKIYLSLGELILSDMLSKPEKEIGNLIDQVVKDEISVTDNSEEPLDDLLLYSYRYDNGCSLEYDLWRAYSGKLQDRLNRRRKCFIRQKPQNVRENGSRLFDTILPKIFIRHLIRFIIWFWELFFLMPKFRWWQVARKQASESGWTPLFYAAVRGDVEVAKILLADGANVNWQDVQGWTPLYLTVKNGDKNVKEVITLLIRSGADPNIPDENGCTALHLAKKQKKTDLVQLMETCPAPPQKIP